MKTKKMYCPKTGWLCIAVITVVLLIAVSCATREKTIVDRAGIKGTVVPTDASGNEIEMQDRGGVIINCIPLREGKQKQEMAITANTQNDGSFSIGLPGGEYMIEIFLEGFYVKSFHLDLKAGKRYNLGKIALRKIEVGEGMPLKNSEQKENIGSEGDVTIQPPVM